MCFYKGRCKVQRKKKCFILMNYVELRSLEWVSRGKPSPSDRFMTEAGWHTAARGPDPVGGLFLYSLQAKKTVWQKAVCGPGVQSLYSDRALVQTVPPHKHGGDTPPLAVIWNCWLC